MMSRTMSHRTELIATTAWMSPESCLLTVLMTASDTSALTPGALDLSNFLVALKVHFALQSDALTKVFLETYVESQSPERFAGFRIYHALTYLRRAMICFRWKSGPEWRQQVRQLLETSNAVLNKKYF